LIAGQILDDRTIELTFPTNPDGKYLLKGGTPSVWKEFRLPAKWRSQLGEGMIDGKRSGVTQNIGPLARPEAKGAFALGDIGKQSCSPCPAYRC
jgi:hypothetical protein